MREIRTSGLMSGDGKRSVAAWPKPPRPSSTLQLVGALVALLSRLEASNAAVAAANRNLPAGAGHMLNAEVLARGVDPNMRIGLNPVAPICTAVKLPELEGDLAARGATAWPPSRGAAGGIGFTKLSQSPVSYLCLRAAFW